VQCIGQIKNGSFGSLDLLYCRYTFHYGTDWSISSGLDTGLSQTACRNPSRPNDPIVWNFPIDLSFTSTNVFGWPRLALSVYGVDFLGRDVIRGYGSALIPIKAGLCEIEVNMFVPLAQSYANQLISWIMGNPPEVRYFSAVYFFFSVSLNLCFFI
jgi:B9 domain-containing protein 1